jgi:glycosyltransferase involved in cell wall biosynthesis
MTPERKKILYVITKSNFGGAQRYVYELATELPRDTFEVVVAFGGNGILKEKLESAGIRTRTVENFERDIHFFKEFNAYKELKKIIEEESPDIVHLNSSKAAALGAYAARACGIKKVIFTAHGWPFFEDRSFLWRKVIWFVSWLTVRKSDDVILVSQYDHIHSHMENMRKKFSVIRTAVSSIPFLSRDNARARLFPEAIRTRHQHDTWVVSTGEHTRNKNLFYALKAVEKYNAAHDTKVFLTLMSDGEERSGLEKFVVKHNMQDSVFFTGYVDGAREQLKAFDIFILPSRKEGMPYGLLEAGSAGLACIASNVGGIPEIIDNQKNGLLIDPKDEDSLVNALHALTSTSEKATRYARSLQDKIATQFSLLRMLEKTVELYKK